MMSIDYRRARVVFTPPIIILDSVQTVRHPLPSAAAKRLAVPSIHYTAVSPCHTKTASASLGSVVQAHRNGKLVKATKLAVRNLVRKKPKLNVPPSHINLTAKEEDVRDEEMLFNWD